MTLLPGSTQQVVTADGASLAVQRWDGDQPGLGFVHATGFTKELWGPVVDVLHRRRVDAAGWAVDQRGHGDSSVMPIPMDWARLGSDMAEVMTAAGSGRTIGVGHSSGGAALAIAALDNPNAFQRLVLIEPIITPPPHVRHDHDPMAEVAARRRSSFPDRESAEQSFRSKSPFRNWVDDAMDAYVQSGLRDEGDEVVLKCSPATEAEHYRSGWAHSTWDRLGEIACPVTLIAGSRLERGNYVADLAMRLAEVDVHVVPDASHFVPMEQPDVVAGLISDLQEGR